MTEILLLVGIVVLAVYLRSKDVADELAEDATPPAKQCPPHKWEYVTVQGLERIKCKLCSKTPGQAAGLE